MTSQSQSVGNRCRHFRVICAIGGACMDVIFFFFSSRRRHTRCSRDWSSDVCSSDLDSAEQRATVRLYEPNGQPFRDVEEVQLGRTDPGTGGFVVRAEDLVPGVYELDVIAPPLSGVSVTARAEVAPLLLSDNEASNPGDATAGGRLTRTLVGAERRVDVTGRGAPPESLTVRGPDWAIRAVIDGRMPPGQG